MKVKALITAAGVGRRLGAVTQKTHKGLLVIEKKPLILHIIDQFHKVGIKNIILTTGYQAERVKKCVGKQAKTVFNPFYKVSGILGSFWAARHHLAGHPFVFTTCDHYFRTSVLRSCLKPRRELQICVQKKDKYTQEDAKVVIQGGRIVGMGKDIPVDRADGEFGGLVTFDRMASKLFFNELENQLEMGNLHGYVMDILNVMRDRDGMPIYYSLCREQSRIEIDYVHDLIQARNMKRKKNKGKDDGIQI